MNQTVHGKPLFSLATPTGFEPVTPRLGIWCSIQLSYGAFEVTLVTKGQSAISASIMHVEQSVM